MNEIAIRKYQKGDEEELYRLIIESFSHLKPWMPWAVNDYSMSDTRSWVDQCISDWDRSAAFRYLVVDSKSGAIVGATGLERVVWCHRIAELGYWVGVPHLNLGIATKAARETVKEAFSIHKLNRIEINILQDNLASNRVAYKLGSTFEGAFRNKLFHNGKSNMANCYSLIPEDCKNLTSGSSRTSAKALAP